MSGERAKRFPLALEDLKREPRKPEGRVAERQAAGDAARQRLTAAAVPAAASPIVPERRAPHGGVFAAKPARAKQHAPAAPGAAKRAPQGARSRGTGAPRRTSR